MAEPQKQSLKPAAAAFDDNRPLKLLEGGIDREKPQFGFQKLDDTTVLERKKIPVCVYSNTDNAPWGVWIRIYDFQANQVLSYVQDVYSNRFAPATQVMNFSSVENPAALRDAHRALVELGGNPAPLDDILGYSHVAKPVIVRGPQS